MKRALILFFLIFTTVLTFGQKTLSEQLWEQVQDCYANFEDMDDDGKLDYDAVDDSRNGYLKISGDWPTCGCGCTSTVAAFKDHSGKYAFLKKEEYSCDWVQMVSSNRPMKDILPVGFGIKSFIPNEEIPQVENAIFYYDMEIPQYGTDSKISIHLIPFGLYMKSNSALSNGYKQDWDNQNFSMLSPLKRLGEEILDDQVLFDIANADFDKLIEEDQRLIEEVIDESPHIQSPADVSMLLNDIYTAYKYYLSIKHKSFLLGWDKAKSRFYIKSKGEEVELMTFKQFIEEAIFWGPIC